MRSGDGEFLNRRHSNSEKLDQIYAKIQKETLGNTKGIRSQSVFFKVLRF
jgi:hypothetical protein